MNDPGLPPERTRQFMDCRECHTVGHHTKVDGCVLWNPRENADAAYHAFMRMSDEEWSGLVRSLLLEGGILEPAESQGFERAYDERRAL